MRNFTQLLLSVAAAAALAGCTPEPARTAAIQPAAGLQPQAPPSAPAMPGGTIYFEHDSAVLTQAAQTTLINQANFLAGAPQSHVMIAGNCDERGTEVYNLALGARRAHADRDFLVAHGTAPNRITTISYGSERPSVLGSTPDAWARNRNAITSIQ